MTTVTKIAALFAICFVIFGASGLVAQFVLSNTHCIWASTAIFGVSFVGLGSMIFSLVHHLLDINHLF
jgi:hypothetical protein